MCERRKPYETDTQHKINFSGYQWSLQMLGDTSGMIILDNACGTGYGTDLLAQHCKTAYGIDISDEAINFCTTNFKRFNLNYKRIDSVSLTFPDSFFDAVISQDTIEHVADDHAFLDEIYRVLKPGGMLIIFTPQGKGKTVKPENIYHLREYTKEEFDGFLKMYFINIRYYGRRKGSILAQMENTMNTVRKFDPINLRRIIPRKIRHFFGSLLTKNKTGVGLADVNFKHIDYIQGIQPDTNLIAVCEKNR